jgi:hypothetical protein
MYLVSLNKKTKINLIKNINISENLPSIPGAPGGPEKRKKKKDIKKIHSPSMFQYVLP